MALSYCTIADIRRESGFVNNTNLADARVTETGERAQSEVESYLRGVYTLPLSSTPDLIEYITMLLASGYLLIREYGPESRDTDKDGYKKCAEARALLQQIAAKTLLLVDSTGAVLPTSSTHRLGYFPTSSTEPGQQISMDRMTQPF
jgi:phage gp36-like protein